MIKKFFIIGGYAHSNPGDIAILKTTVRRLHTLHPGSHFVIWSDRKNFSVELSGEISSEIFWYRCPSFFAGDHVLPRALLYLFRLTYPFSQTFVRWVSSEKGGAVVRKMRECECIIFVGGGYINSNYVFDLMQMYQLGCLAGEAKKPVYFLGQTIGPFSDPWHKTIAESMLRRAKRIVIREKYSRVELSKFPDKILEGIDDAVDFHTTATSAISGTLLECLRRTDDSQLLLGLSLRSAGKTFDSTGLVDCLNRFNTTSAGGRLKVIFIPMTTSIHSDDRKEAALLERVPNRNFELLVADGPLTVEDRFFAISKVDLLLGMRFHSLVFALSSGVPCIGLYANDYYFRKNWGLLEAYGMERFW